MDRDNRRHQRKELAAKAGLRTIENAPLSVEVWDLSQFGCRIECVPFSLEKEKRVLLRLSGFESLLGMISWVSGSSAGIKFDHPLHVAIVDHICRENPKGAPTVVLALAA